MSGIGFSGFPRECVKFFNHLKHNNNKPWFQEHKDDFVEYVMAPSRDFVVDMGEMLKHISPGVHADPRVDKSIFRIYRDIRFSKDKSPYKTHLAMWFWEGNRPRMECSGYYLHLEPPNLMLGVGIYRFPREMMRAYRDSVVHPKHGSELVRAIQDVSRCEKYSIGGRHYKRMPREYDPQHENAELLLYNGLHLGFETEIPEIFYTADLVDYCYEVYKEMFPIHKWLVEMTERVTSA